MTLLRRIRGLTLLAVATCGLAVPALADDEGAAAGVAKPRWAVQVKRQATARGTADETTMSQIRLEHFPEGAVRLLRLELPFPDEETDFSGSPFNPRLGDLKLRVGWRAVAVLGRPWTSFVEAVFPTADPESLGKGRYQISGGVRHAHPLGASDSSGGWFRHTLALQIQQVVSVGNADSRADINQTKFELEWRGDRPSGRYLKVTGKPVVDWEDDADTGAVGEVEFGVPVDAAWTIALMGGARIWGEGVSGTYSKRVELKATCRF